MIAAPTANTHRYWTRERMNSAGTLGPSVRKVATLGFEEIPDNERDIHPYNNIGLLLFTMGTDDYFGTAFAPEIPGKKNIIFTAAHNLVNKKEGYARNITFIPGMKTDGTSSFGMYDAIPGGSEKGFFLGTHFEDIDIGAVKLQKFNGIDLGDAVTPSLKIICDQQYNEKTVFTCFGYPEIHTMIKHVGKYKEKNDTIVVKQGDVPEGMSGGPWFLNETNTVNGNTSKGDNTQTTSPYYSTTNINDLLKRLD